MNIIIDPYMLELEDEEEIKQNISFFRVLIFLSRLNRIRVFLYKDLVEKMLCREVKPFPIHIGKIRDDNLKAALLSINTLFVSAVMNNITPIDVEACKGEQDFAVESDERRVENILNTDDKYFELLSILLQQCYNSGMVLSNTIVKGEIRRGLEISDEFRLNCQCYCQKYDGKYCIDIIDKFASDVDKAYIKLDQIIMENGITCVSNPEIVRGKHHNFLQANSNFSTYDGLSRVNKAVISLLRRFGLSKIIFGEFHEDSSYPQGTIVTNDIQIVDGGDIVKGWLYAETGYKNHVDLYFPKYVGKNLMIYLNNVFDRNSVQRLVDTFF